MDLSLINDLVNYESSDCELSWIIKRFIRTRIKENRVPYQ